MTQPATLAPNGPVAAALLCCAFGCFALGVLAVAADGSQSLAALLNFYNPTGPLAGVTTVAIALWLVGWAVLSRVWRAKTVSIAKVSTVAFVLLAASLLLTFPPFGDLLLGR
jgi:ABC-type dipeptide/oligopeptide/nickel transport system permease subunit